MGLRYRKSINLGGGFRINLSKNGVGYSYGVKGYRVTKKSTGGVRRTASIPGTGLSWVEETSGKKQHNQYSNPYHGNNVQQSDAVQTYDTQNIENAVATTLVSDGLEELLAAAKKVSSTYLWLMISFWVSLVMAFVVYPLFFVAIALLIYAIWYRAKKKIHLDYCIDEDYRAEVEKNLEPLIRITQCKKVWRIIQSSKSVDTKYSSGAQNLIKRVECVKSTKATFPFKTTEKVASFRSSKETLLFLPDKLIIIQGRKIGALDYADIEFSARGTRFVETQIVPRDATVVDHTWEYVNKSGGPDKRFKNNRRLPVCQYGELTMTSSSGLNTVIMFSNINLK